MIPLRRPGIDHEINLTDETKSVFSPTYNLSENELKVFKKYIEDYLGKGFIQLFTLSFGSPILFEKKPNGSLYLYIDYRVLNCITVKNCLSLPLIYKTLDRLCKAKYFTKIDLLSAFNQICITLDTNGRLDSEPVKVSSSIASCHFG